jgi:hypothetical protein
VKKHAQFAPIVVVIGAATGLSVPVVPRFFVDFACQTYRLSPTKNTCSNFNSKKRTAVSCRPSTHQIIYYDI